MLNWVDMRGQYTLKESIEWSGRTLHTGVMSSVRVAPAAAGFGIKFKRTDLDIDKWISADTRYVTSTDRSTNVGSGEVEIATVEHLLAAFRGVGIDCAEVYVDGPEIPILDGSSAQFYEDMLPLKHSLEATSTKVWSPREVISYEHAETGARFTLLPAKKFSCEVVLTFDHKDIGERYAQYTESDDFGQVASSRTFVFSNELVGLAKKGLIKGGSLENAIVIPSPETGEQELREALQMLGMNDIDNTVERVSDGFALRSKNELARHKLLDLIGDLVLVGCRINGRIMAEKPGHTANVAFAKHLRALHQKSLKLKGKPVYDPTADPIYDIEAVRGFLPHRYPFLLVDKIIELTDTHVVGV
ncbi:MAG: UDP-3-O-acyl-N-acetylglucosamine deacetylase, partial [Bacteroidota bacterium]